MDDYQVHNIALKTLKQRCEYLQQRLDAVEEENCKLKLEKVQNLNSKISREPDRELDFRENNNLEERLIILNKEKSQMAHQIEMITNENFILWSELNKVLPGNIISSLKFSIPAAPDNQAFKFTHYEKISDDYEKESLEEISLKLINGIIMGKNELEKQYTQMIDLQRENIAEENSSFIPVQFDNRAAVKNLKDLVQKLKDFKQALYKQKNELSSAISVIKNSPIFSRQSYHNFEDKNISNCDHTSYNRESNINNNQSESEFSTLQDSGKLGNGDDKLDLNELICPMCGESFNKTFEDFYQHVSEHFEDEEFLDARGNLEGEGVQ